MIDIDDLRRKGKEAWAKAETLFESSSIEVQYKGKTMYVPSTIVEDLEVCGIANPAAEIEAILEQEYILQYGVVDTTIRSIV